MDLRVGGKYRLGKKIGTGSTVLLLAYQLISRVEYVHSRLSNAILSQTVSLWDWQAWQVGDDMRLAEHQQEVAHRARHEVHTRLKRSLVIARVGRVVFPAVVTSGRLIGIHQTSRA
ncbi:hypothetical protein FRC12_008390 [Ceratobasidium sp. 428]|nr:hypothetical protein FRC12_008390 [Ceratobasidium sp. 428]